MRLCACFTQMGGLRGLLPLLENAAGWDLRLHGREPVLRYLRGLPALPALPPLPLEDAFASLEDADVLLTDTINLSRSARGARCRDLWEEARRAGVPSVAFVDSWWGYRERFLLPGEDLTTATLPDVVAVVDDIAHQDMLDAGFAPERLRVLGSPWLSSLAGRRRRDGVRADLDIGAEEFVLAFVSQPLARVLNDRDAWGFTEEDVLPALLRACGELPPDVQDRLRVLCLAHPEEDEQALAELIRAQAPAFPAQACKVPDPLELVGACDLVTGMFSILLVEAALCGVPVLSIQPGLRREDMLVTNRTGATLALRQAEQLPAMLRRMACDAPFRAHRLERQRRFPVIADSRARWTRLLHTLAASRSAQA